MIESARGNVDSGNKILLDTLASCYGLYGVIPGGWSRIMQPAVKLSSEFEPMQKEICDVLTRACKDFKSNVKKAEERRQVRPREAVLNGEDFKALWDRIKHKTTYRVHFDNEQMLAACTNALRDMPKIPRPWLEWTTTHIAIGQSGVQTGEPETGDPVSLVDQIELPDILTELQNRTQLTRKSILRILLDSERLEEFSDNPQKFIEEASERINRQKRLSLVDGIKYQRLGDESYFAQELFFKEDLSRHLKDLVESKKSAYEYVICDVPNEAKFAKELEQSNAVKVYAKLPRWFQVPTPLGTYNPDWAVVIQRNDDEHLYFVAETKGTSFLDDLRYKERAKVECAKVHFNALNRKEAPFEYRVVSELNELFT